MVAFRPFESAISPNMEFQPDPTHRRSASNVDLDDEDLLVHDPPAGRALPPLRLPPISSKPWLVVATKADLPETQENFIELQKYLSAVQDGKEVHPSGKKNGWCRKVQAVPVSAINKQGVQGIPGIILELLDD